MPGSSVSLKWYDTLVVTVTALVPFDVDVVQETISALEPISPSPGGQAAPHGLASGSWSSVSAEARSFGRYMSTFCSPRATFRRPSVLSACRNVTVIDAARTVAMIPIIVTEISSSGSVMPASRRRDGCRAAPLARSDIALHHLDPPT